MSDPLKQRNRELTILNKIAAALNSTVDLRQALDTTLQMIVDLFALKTGWIYLFNEQIERFYAASTLNLPPALADHPRRLSGGCLCLDTYLDGDLDDPANFNALECSRLKDLSEGTQGLQYHASIPLYAMGKKLGVLNVASPDWREIDPDGLRLLYTVADLMSMAIERARLFQRSREMGAVQERNRLAREIHDTLAQGLAGIALQLEIADATLSQNGAPDAQQAVERALTMARDNLEEARRSVQDLRAAPLRDRTLPSAIRALLAEVEADASLETYVKVMGSGPPLPSRTANTLYRITQEAIQNVRRHAGATYVKVKLNLTPDEVHLIVLDDGCGFDIGMVPDGHYGIIGIEERVALLGGDVQITTAPGEGTRIEVQIPLEGHDDNAE